MDLVTPGALGRVKYPRIQNLVLSNAGAAANSPALFYESYVDNIVANPGGGQANAVQLTAEVNRVTTVATVGNSVKLPPSVQINGQPSQAGLSLLVINHGTNPMQVFGSGTDTVNDSPAATGVSQMQGSLTIYVCTSTGKWYSQGLGEGYSGSYATFSSQDNLTAKAGGGQAGATMLPAMTNRLTTVATAGDSALLPQSVNGMQITVIDAGANAMNVFPTGTDQINTLGASQPFSVPAGKTCEFYCVTAGQWHTLLSS